MTFNDTVTLIPCHSLEDFPTDLGDKPAEGLLNAFTVAWHPWLLAQTRSLPGWHRADSPPEPTAGRLILVPTHSQDHLSSDWIARQREAGSCVISGITKRDELLTEILSGCRDATFPGLCPSADAGTANESSDAARAAPIATAPEQLDAELVADFLSLGTTHLFVELLSRQMHYFGEIDEMRLRREAVAAAEALLANRPDDVRQRLSACFEALHEARERFYPVDAYLLDLCLLTPSTASDKLAQLLTDSKPLSVLLTAHDAEDIARDKPELAKLLREAVQREVVEIIGGEWSEVASPIMPLESVVHDIRRGIESCRRLFGREPTTWSRRRFGLHTLLPQLLTKCGYSAATHYLLDDGIYPDAESSKLRWEGCDSTTIDSISRLPLAADGATSYLRLPQRLAEAMQQDQGAGLIFARWPDVRSPFFHDLVRGVKYSPVLGKFATFREFFERTDTPMRHTRYEAGEYLSPFLTRSVAAREPNAISRFIDHFERRQRFDVACWLQSTATVLRGRRLYEVDSAQVEQLVERAGPDACAVTPEKPTEDATPADDNSDKSLPDSKTSFQEADAAIHDLATTAQRELAQTILHGTTEKQPGLLIVNPLSFTRRVSASVPSGIALPAVGGAIKGVCADDSRREMIVEVPGCGFVWLPTHSPASSHQSTSQDDIKTPLVEDNTLRNEFFEVHVSPETGGIQRIKEYGRKPIRLSQQLAYRFPRERTNQVTEDDQVFEEKSFYSETRCRGIEVVSRGPYLGEVRTAGDIIDQKTEAVLATFRQAFRLWRGRRILDIDIELDTVKPPEGDPWTNYFGVRWAWLDSTAALTRSMLGAAQPIGNERFESPHYLEIADDDTRTTILMHGLPFHRKTGRRMCDSLLIVEGESRRRFRFSIAFERPYPLAAALDAMSPVFVIPTEVGPPRCGATGWFFHVDAPNVQLTRLTDFMNEPRSDLESWALEGQPEHSPGSGFAVRLQETEGRRQSVALRCFRTATSARRRDFTGRTTGQPRIDGDAVRLELSPFEITDLELRFDPPPPSSPQISETQTSD